MINLVRLLINEILSKVLEFSSSALVFMFIFFGVSLTLVLFGYFKTHIKKTNKDLPTGPIWSKEMENLEIAN